MLAQQARILTSQGGVPVSVTSEIQLNPILYSIHLNLISLYIKQECDLN